MTAGPDAGERQAQRLLRWYPASWRARYGDEFTELLIAEFADQPRSWRRTANVARSGLLARCTCAGLTGHELPPAQQIQAGLATLGCALAVFLTFGVAMLAQLATGWQWSSPGSVSVAAGTVLMAAAAAALVLLGLASAIPAGGHAMAAALRSREPRLAWPAGLVISSAVILVAGARHFQNYWPGTGGTGAEHALIPAGIAAFGWASTLSVSSYWAHPGLLGHFPVSELAWMALSPLAVITLVAGLLITVRTVAMPDRLLRYQARLAPAATVPAVIFLAGAGTWVLGHGSSEPGLFRAGLMDNAELAIMALTLVVALQAAGGIRRASRANRAGLVTLGSG